LRHVGRYHVTLLLNLDLVSRVKLCLVGGFPHIVKDYPKMRNLPKIFLRSFENVDIFIRCSHLTSWNERLTEIGSAEIYMHESSSR